MTTALRAFPNPDLSRHAGVSRQRDAVALAEIHGHHARHGCPRRGLPPRRTLRRNDALWRRPKAAPLPERTWTMAARAGRSGHRAFGILQDTRRRRQPAAPRRPADDFRQIRVIEKFLACHRGRYVVSRNVWSRSLAVSWYTLGRALIQDRKIGFARKCFLRSIYWQKTFHKPWLRLARTYYRA